MAKIADLIQLNVKRLRADIGISQEDLADKIGVARQTINKYESGIGGISIEMLQKIAAGLGAEESELVWDPSTVTEPIKKHLEAIGKKLQESIVAYNFFIRSIGDKGIDIANQGPTSEAVTALRKKLSESVEALNDAQVKSLYPMIHGLLTESPESRLARAQQLVESTRAQKKKVR